MTADQPTICPTCQGVIVAQQSSAYTPARGRLIVGVFSSGPGLEDYDQLKIASQLTTDRFPG